MLIERNEIPREEMSMQRIREWMKVNPDKAAEVRATNRSFVFFRITGLDTDGEPVGAQGVPLMPRPLDRGRQDRMSTARRSTSRPTLPIDSARPMTPFRRLMIAQDTGSAIVGPARADLYLGAGDVPARIAGRIRHPGRFVMLLPRELDMVEAGKTMPLPLVKPANIVEEGKKEAAEADGESRPPRKPAKKPPRKTHQGTPTQGQPRSPPSRTAIRKLTRRSRHRNRAGRRSAGDHGPAYGSGRWQAAPAQIVRRRAPLWHRVTRSIAPLKRARSKAEPADREIVAPGDPTPPKAKPPARVTKSRPAAAVKPAPNPRRCAPLDRKQKKRLARGTEPIDARIDLHGLTQSEAHSGAAAFPAPRAAPGGEVRAGDHRQGPLQPGDVSREAACSSARCRNGCGCRNSATM